MPTSKRCPNCGAGLDYLPKGRVYYCRYCKTEFDDPEAAASRENQHVQVVFHTETPPLAQPSRFSGEKPQKNPKGLKYLILMIVCLIWLAACVGAFWEEKKLEDLFAYGIIALPAIWGIWRLNWGGSGKRR